MRSGVLRGTGGLLLPPVRPLGAIKRAFRAVFFGTRWARRDQQPSHR